MTNLITSLPYSTKSVAVRGAKRAGLENFTTEQRADGKWYIVDATKKADDFEMTDAEREGQTIRTEIADSKATDAELAAIATKEVTVEDMAKMAAGLPKRVKSTPEEIAARRAARQAKPAAPKADKPARVPAYKEMARTAPAKSLIGKPVEVIHNYLEANFGTKTRKALIADLVAMGINIHTCRTQYQIFSAKRAAAIAEAEAAKK